SRQRQKMELDRQEYFANDREIIILQQGIIGQKTSRNGVFDRHHDVVCFSMLHFLEHPFEGHAFHGVDIFTEIGACRFVVEGSPYALYCYGRSFRHYFLQKKNPELLTRDFQYSCSNVPVLQQVPMGLIKKVKVKPVV